MLHALNAVLVRRRGRFCTLALVKLRPLADGHVEGTVALGGHDHPLVRRAGGCVERIGHTGTLIGAVEDIAVRDCAFRLAPEDALLLFSDGVAPYGDESLCRALAEPADARSLCARVDADGATDDVTLLCVRAV
jgi:serine phosphatase RsbU (regulator of sigma subunit)